MQPTSVRALFFSPTGTSRKIARTLARAIGGGGSVPEIDITHTAASPAELSPRDTVVLAVPVYGGHIPSLVRERLAPLRGTDTPIVIVVVYGNRAYENAAAELAGLAASQGFIPIAAAAFIGEHSYSTPRTPIAAGRPDTQDLSVAEDFGHRIRTRLRSDTLAPIDIRRLAAPRTPFVPLVRFIGFVLKYLWQQKRHPQPLLPDVDTSRCKECGRCAALCPVQAIDPGDLRHTDSARCIRCCACVKGCAAGARTFYTPFAEALARNFDRRKPPVTLL